MAEAVAASGAGLLPELRRSIRRAEPLLRRQARRNGACRPTASATCRISSTPRDTSPISRRANGSSTSGDCHARRDCNARSRGRRRRAARWRSPDRAANSSRCSELAAEVGADVEFLGFLTGAALHDAIRSARAVVLPSEWYENAPMSVLEAYALGKPVIGARIGGIPELVRGRRHRIAFRERRRRFLGGDAGRRADDAGCATWRAWGGGSRLGRVGVHCRRLPEPHPGASTASWGRNRTAARTRTPTMKFIVLGVRGLPNVEGGVETHAEQPVPATRDARLRRRSPRRTPFVPPRARYLRSDPTAPNLVAADPRHRGIRAFRAGRAVCRLLRRPDILHIHAIGPAIVTPLARLLGLRSRRHPSWPRLRPGQMGHVRTRPARRGALGMRWSNARIVDLAGDPDLVRDDTRRECEVIPNGVRCHWRARRTTMSAGSG